MGRMRRELRGSLTRLAVGAALLGAVVLAPTTALAQSSSDVPFPQESVLGVVHADSGRYADGKLTLSGVDAPVWFADRPGREAGTLDLKEFTKLFFRGDDPPNAAVVIDGAPASHDVVIVELSQPKVNMKAGTVTIAAKEIPEVDKLLVVDHPHLAPYAADADPKLPAKFGAVSMFVDDAANVLPPPVVQTTPDAQDVTNLVNQADTLSNEYIQEIPVMNQWIEQPGDLDKNCVMALRDQANDNEYEILQTVRPALQALQAIVAQNDGILPVSADGQYQTVATQVSELTTAAPEFTPDYVSHYCRASTP
ncbi:MAG: hypothetical protein U0W40_17240 [Acidimicrobiia bacterium]